MEGCTFLLYLHMDLTGILALLPEDGNGLIFRNVVFPMYPRKWRVSSIIILCVPYVKWAPCHHYLARTRVPDDGTAPSYGW
jgi:hypothetical protein